MSTSPPKPKQIDDSREKKLEDALRELCETVHDFLYGAGGLSAQSVDWLGIKLREAQTVLEKEEEVND